MSKAKKSPNQINIENMFRRSKDALSISPTMCTAKWLQSTVYLMNGFTHSCHHPAPHKIPLEEIQSNAAALHNTRHKKAQREMMLEGSRPPECQYCWSIEDLPGQHISDRIYKSADQEWSHPFLNRILECGSQENINPTYLEVAFENTCNFKCAYCSPDISSKWLEEIRNYGPYPTSWKTGDLDWLRSDGRLPYDKDQENPYVDAFWKWWPTLYDSLKTFRITGGEPLLSKNTWRILEEVKNNPRHDFTLAINTNMGVPDSILDRLISEYRAISPHIKNFEIYTSCEAAGAPAEYIRYGMDYNKFLNNIRRFLAETGPDSRINITVTFNLLSITSFKKFLEDIWQLRVDFNQDDALNRVPIHIAYLRWPPFLSARLLPQEIKNTYAKSIQDFVSNHTRVTSPSRAGRFYLEEMDQLDRLFAFLNTQQPNMERDLEDFNQFITEYDKRRSLSFQDTFPELKTFMNSIAEKYLHDNFRPKN